MLHLTLGQARKMGIKDVPKESKYKSRKVQLDGIWFDSEKEANRYTELKMMLQAGEIISLKLQPEFILEEGYRDGSGKWQRPIKYRADFEIVYPNGHVVVIDTKGYKTKEYRMKIKMFRKRYPQIDFREE